MGDPTNSAGGSTRQRMVPLRSVIAVAVLILVLVVVAGFVHIVHGGTLTVCAKDGWALQDTFVDLDDYTGKPLLMMIDKAKVLRAMFACGTLVKPAFLDDEKPRRGAAAMFAEGKIDTTKLKLKKYAYEAYPAWSAAHPDRACPERLADLNEYMNDNDINDSWGRPIKMLCGASLPAGARGIALLSFGEDGKEGTEDDLKSWE